MHRTTIPLEGPVERELRRLAAQEKRSFKELVNDLLRRGLKAYRERKGSKVKFQWHTSKGVPAPWFDPSDRSTYLDVISRKIP
jgi:hypothetical protein